jgi:hypothetical protein
MMEPLNHLEYYRLPWNYADNGISWLEPTTDCNLPCEGCYREPRGPGNKTLDEVRADLEVLKTAQKRLHEYCRRRSARVSPNRRSGKYNKGNGLEELNKYGVFVQTVPKN